VCVRACVCVFLFKTIIAVVVIFVFYVAWEFLFSLGIFYSNVLGFVETESGALVLAVCVCVCVWFGVEEQVTRPSQTCSV